MPLWKILKEVGEMAGIVALATLAVWGKWQQIKSVYSKRNLGDGGIQKLMDSDRDK